MHSPESVPSFSSPARGNARGHGRPEGFFLGRWAVPLMLPAGLLGLALEAAAQDCKLSIEATPKVLVSGQSAAVNVHAHFPAGAHAFASAELDVLSTHPAWSFASAGAVVGTDVVGIAVGQDHLPQAGVVADPTNPIRIWAGAFSPVSAAPALVQFVADPAAFWYYPSALTPSSVPCEAKAGADWVFVNPLFRGGYAAAPGLGTSLDVGPGGFVASTRSDAVTIGLLVPAVPPVREHVGRVGGLALGTDVPAGDLVIHAAPPAAWGEGKKVTIAFTKTAPSRYDVSGEFPLGAKIHFHRAGAHPKEFTVTKKTDTDSRPVLAVGRIPDVLIPPGTEARAGTPKRPSKPLLLGVGFQFNGGVRVAAADLDGGTPFVADQIIVSVGPASHSALEKAGPGTLVLSAGGVGTLSVSAPSRASR